MASRLGLNFKGLVRWPISSTLPQISSRFLYITWGILWSFPQTQNHVLVSSLVISWSVTEIIRYAFFGTKEAFGSAPSWLLWLRYSTFLFLYPTGITSEVGLIYAALQYIKLFLSMDSMSQEALTCMGTCLVRERKLCPNLKGIRAHSGVKLFSMQNCC